MGRRDAKLQIQYSQNRIEMPKDNAGKIEVGGESKCKIRFVEERLSCLKASALLY